MNKPFTLWRRALGLASATLLLSCTTTKAPNNFIQSSNSNQRIQSLVMHFTAVDYAKSKQILVEEGGLSSHYLIPQNNDPTYPSDDLQVIQLVKENERAWHAGVSHWQGRERLNDSSIGIEIVNVPSCHPEFEETDLTLAPKSLCVFKDFDPEQIQLLITLSQGILQRNPDIHPTAVVGHSDIAPSRKIDPGPRFPWYTLYLHGIGAWYEAGTLAEYWRQFEYQLPSISILQQALSRYGYGIQLTGELDQQTIDTIEAFQMHFLPWQVNGEADAQTHAAIFALLARYFEDSASSLYTSYLEEAERARFQQAERTPSNLAQSQLALSFPSVKSKTRTLVNDRNTFLAYQGQGTINIQSDTRTYADIYVNQQKLNITQPLEAGVKYRYSLAKRTRDGVNSISVRNIEAQQARISISIPYPQLVEHSKAWQDRFKAVDALIQSDVEDGFPGAALAVVHKGKIIKKTAYGYAQRYDRDANALSSPEPMTPETLFDIASNTKMFASNLALMHLVAEGKLRLDAKVIDYLPEYRGQGRESITLSQLLDHTSGYASEIPFYKTLEPWGERFLSQRKARTTRLLIEKVPFTQMQPASPVYSDTNYMLLGAIIERIVGEPLDEYVESTFYKPLGLNNTLFTPLKKGRVVTEFAATELMGNTRAGHIDFPNVRTNVIRGEVHDEKAFYSMQGVAGHAGLFSNIDDMAVLAQLMLNQGGYGEQQFFDASVLERFTAPSAASDDLGLGWRRAGQGERAWHFGPYASSRAFGHTGWTGTVTVIDPEYDLAIVLLTNKKHSPILSKDDGLVFAGDEFETGKYGSVISLIYETVIAHTGGQ